MFRTNDRFAFCRMLMEKQISKLRLAVCFSALALAFGAQQMRAATVTYIVGTCKSGTQFSTIQSALDASPAPDTVEVCPGVYNEQIVITKPVTLEGIVTGNGSLAQIELPSGYTNNVFFDNEYATAQIYVNNVSGGDVNLTNLYVGGQGFSTENGYLVGIFYQQSSGTINHVITSTQDDNGNPALNVQGFGILIKGGSSRPSVTVENSSIHDFSAYGILAIGTTVSPDLTVTIKNNNISSFAVGDQPVFNLDADEGTDSTISGNVVNGGFSGIFVDAPTGSITGNTVIGSNYGIVLYADGPSVKSNNIFDTIAAGIYVEVPNLEVSVIEDNTIMTVKSTSSTDSNGTGIDLECSKGSSSQVHSNTIMDSFLGYGDAPAGFAGSGNTYVGVFQDVATCSSNSPSIMGAVARPKLAGNR